MFCANVLYMCSYLTAGGAVQLCFLTRYCPCFEANPHFVIFLLVSMDLAMDMAMDISMDFLWIFYGLLLIIISFGPNANMLLFLCLDVAHLKCNCT